ncbi:MAG: hypothetical protein AB1416_11385 [Actinomycetota bacterium]
MPFLVNSNATILCAHGGRVQIIPRQTTVMAGGAPIVRETDLMGAPILGCAQPPTVSSKPCTAVVSVIPGSGTAMKVTVAGLPAHTQTLTGITDGVPPGTITVVDPGQQKVQGS